MKAPVKDRKTVPWISTIEIPAVKLVLSRWRSGRRSGSFDTSNMDVALLDSYVDAAASLLNKIAIAEKIVREESERRSRQ